jgi:hypothetical protein
MNMSRKMTVVFHDEKLYTYLKVEAARRHTAASEIITDAVRQCGWKTVKMLNCYR